MNIAILIVNRSKSLCSACGKNALPEEIRHETNGEHCGARFVAIGTEYPGFLDDACRAMRPDLPFIDIWVNKNDAPELPRGFIRALEQG